MKLSAAHLAVIADTLHNSLPIMGKWMYTEEARQNTLKDVLDLMQELEINVTESALTSEND